MTEDSRPESLAAEDFDPDRLYTHTPWMFDVKSYQVNITNGATPPNYAAGILLTDNEKGVTGQGQRHAVLQFYWEGKAVPKPGPPPEKGFLLHLNFSVSEYAGIMELLKGPAKLRVYYKPDQNYGGIMQLTATSTPPHVRAGRL